MLILVIDDWCISCEKAITWANVDPDLYRHMASLGHNEIRFQIKCFYLPWYKEIPLHHVSQSVWAGRHMYAYCIQAIRLIPRLLDRNYMVLKALLLVDVTSVIFISSVFIGVSDYCNHILHICVVSENT